MKEVTAAAVELLKRRLSVEQKKNELLQARLCLPTGTGGKRSEPWQGSVPSSTDTTQRTCSSSSSGGSGSSSSSSAGTSAVSTPSITARDARSASPAGTERRGSASPSPARRRPASTQRGSRGSKSSRTPSKRPPTPKPEMGAKAKAEAAAKAKAEAAQAAEEKHQAALAKAEAEAAAVRAEVESSAASTVGAIANAKIMAARLAREERRIARKAAAEAEASNGPAFELLGPQPAIRAGHHGRPHARCCRLALEGPNVCHPNLYCYRRLPLWRAELWMSEWNTWIAGINLPQLILDALQMPRAGGEQAAFEYMRGLTRETVASLLAEARLEGLTDVLMDGIDKLGRQSAASGPALNDKFQQSGKFTMGYGSLDVFFNGLETLLGPPQMVKDPEAPDGAATLLMGMRADHTMQKDATDEFTSSNGVTTTSAVEWQFAYAPDCREGAYPERAGFAEAHPNWCRIPKPLDELMECLETVANSKLRSEGHNELVRAHAWAHARTRACLGTRLGKRPGTRCGGRSIPGWRVRA